MTELNGKKEIRVIALDVDGTLLDSKHALTPRVETALNLASAKGVQIVLATGKTRTSMLKIIEQLKIKSAGIYLQGLAIYDENGDLRHQQTLDPAIARQVITYGEDRGFVMVAYSGERILARVHNKEVEEGLTVHHELAPEVVGPLQNLLGNMSFNKLIACGDPKAIKALRWQLNVQLGGSVRLMQAGIPTMLEIMPPGGSKGAALRQLLKDMKVAPENVMAIGDAENDIEMIKLAGIGVAMGQSHQAVKDAADDVTGTNDEDGVAKAVEKFVLGEPVTPPPDAKAVVIEPPDETPAEATAAPAEASAAEKAADSSKEDSAL
jgi:Cof subfamily protein (haloacid dehalogenase superfamily)